MYTCPCCGYKTLKEEHEYNICSICYWEDDWYQFVDVDSIGANKVSLREAQKNYLEFGACDKSVLNFVRPPGKYDVHDIDWKPLD